MHQGPRNPQSIIRSRPSRLARLAASATLVLGLAASTALAVHPGHWVHNSEAEFDPGAKENTLVTNLGDIRLSGQTEVMAKMPESVSVIYDLRTLADGDLYIAAGPEGALLRRRGEKIEQVVTLKDEQIFALATLSDGRLLVAVSGAKSRLAVLADDKLADLVQLPGVRYVWSLAVHGDDIYLTTGTKGKLLKVDLAAKDAAGQPKVATLLDVPQANLLSLAIDKQGRIYAGSDTDGLVYRVTEMPDGSLDKFVVFNAPEPEIGAILAAADGNIYIGTADADQAHPGRLEPAASGEAGRPGPDAAKPAPKNPATPPTPPPAPPTAPKPTPAAGKPQDSSPTGDMKEPGQTPAKQPAPAAPKAPNTADAPAGMTAEPGQPGAAPQKPAVTPEQRDQLRQIIRQRLEAARKSGDMQVGPGGSAGPGPGRPMLMQGTPSRPLQPGAKQGNAVYRIAPDGVVTEVFRESMMVLRMAEHNGKILVATGNEGHVYSLDPAAGEHALLVDLDPQQASALLVGPDGQVILGTSNPSTLVSLSRDTAKEGTYTSLVLDAGQISLWGKISLTGSIPAGSSIDVETRSGNVQDPQKAPWSDWKKAGDLTPENDHQPLAPMAIDVASPPARFLQYRLTLRHQGVLASPVVHKVEITFVVPNLKPVIVSIQTNYPGTPPPTPSGNPAQPQPMQRGGPPRPVGAAGGPDAGPVSTLSIDWEAADPNNDQLVYTLEYQPAGTDRWLPLAKDLKETHFEWHTTRVPDGRYVVRVTASDLPDNSPDMALKANRVSDPILVDNTPPALDLDAQAAKGSAEVSGQAKDDLSLIQSIYYAVDSTDTWQYILPENAIYDSTTEKFKFTIPDLAPGQHVITVRATDARGNFVQKAKFVDVN